jgi:hypothetical protein
MVPENENVRNNKNDCNVWLMFQVSKLTNHKITRKDNWIMMPSDETKCPEISNLDLSVVCVRQDFANDPDIDTNFEYVSTRSKIISYLTYVLKNAVNYLKW